MESLEEKLKKLADYYEVEGFIKDDPVQFPHRYTEKKDVEISAFVTSWISYGNRKAIISKANFLDAKFSGSPYKFLKNREFEVWQGSRESFYRFYKYADLYDLFEALHKIYLENRDMEEAVLRAAGDSLVSKVQALFAGVKGVPSVSGDSACKRISMFLRWMVRKNSPVDLGLWSSFGSDRLVIPLDTHVWQQAVKLGITNRKAQNMQTAREITDFFRPIFGDDPARGDFALFGFGVNSK